MAFSPPSEISTLQTLPETPGGEYRNVKITKKKLNPQSSLQQSFKKSGSTFPTPLMSPLTSISEEVILFLCLFLDAILSPKGGYGLITCCTC